MTDDEELAAARYGAMRWNTPLSAAHAGRLVDALQIGAGARILDLGCGWGELLLCALAEAPGDARAVGVDTDAGLLARARGLARDRGLAQRVDFVQSAAQEWREGADVLLCVGASHAWGSTPAALAALRALTAPGGRLVFGDGCWERPPTDAAARLFGAEVVPLGQIADLALGAGWRVLHADTADQREWDDFESSWRRGREDWLRSHPDHVRAPDVRAELDARLREYMRDYRGVLGFCYLVLAAA